MNHNHTQPSNEENAQKKFLKDTSKCQDPENLNQTQYNLESLNVYDCTTSLIPEPEEIPTETLKMDSITHDNSSICSCNRADWVGDQKAETADQESLLNNTFSGVDISMVRTLLGTQLQSQDDSEQCISDKTGMSITIECAVPGEILNSSSNLESTDMTDQAMVETIQGTSGISDIMDNGAHSNNMEYDSMRNPEDYTKNMGVKTDPVRSATITDKELYDTGNHVFDCYIENDNNTIHNQDYDLASDGSVLICSTVGEVKSSLSETEKGLEKKTPFSLLRIFRKTDQKQRMLHESLKQLISEHPLITEDELFINLKGTDLFSDMKINKKRLVKVLDRLKLSSSYERFRYFVKA